MELSSPKTKKNVIFSYVTSYISERNFSAQKIKKIPPYKNFLYFLKKKKFLIFWEMELSDIFLQKFFLIFLELELSSLNSKKFQEGTFQARKVKKMELPSFKKLYTLKKLP